MSSLEQKQLIRDILRDAEQGNKKEIEGYISRRVVNVCDEEGCTPLMYAAANGQDEIVRLLLDKECISANKLEHNTVVQYINQCNAYGWTALMQAACYGHLNVVICLLQKQADVNIPNSWGATALVGACQGGYFGVVHRLLNVGAKVNPWGEEEAETLTPLMAATQCGHVDIVRELVTRGANVETKLKGSDWTALMLAALNNQLSVSEILLQNKARKDKSDVNGQMASDLAAVLGHHDIVLLLTGKNPTPKASTCTDVEFFNLLKSGDVGKVKDVLGKQKELANCRDKDGATPLMFAASKGNIELCAAVLDADGNANTTDNKYGWTALMLATHQRKYDVVKFLGDRGAKVSVRGKSGSTAFDIANMISDIQMIRLVANISVEQIQRRATGELPPLVDPETMQEHVPMSPSEGKIQKQGDVPTVTEKRDPSKVSSIDLTDLKHKLDKAYKTPTPSISVEGGRPVLKESSPQSRFPTARNRPNSTSRLLGTPTPPSLSSSAASEPLSLASSSSSSSVRTDSTEDVVTVNHAVSSSHPKFRPSNLYLKGSGKVMGLAESPRTSSPHSTPRSSSAGKRPNNSFLLPKSNPGQARDFHLSSKSPNSSVSLRAKSKSTESTRLKFDREFGGSPRVRSDTDPFRSPARREKKDSLSLVQPPPGMDLKSALERKSLSHLYPVLKEQEVDYHSFLNMRVGDLEEIGIKTANRNKLLALITELNTNVFTFQ